VAHREVPRPAGQSQALDALVDWGERLLVLGLYCLLVGRLVNQVMAQGASIPGLWVLPSEGLVVLFILIRRWSSQMSRHVGEWLLALGATCAPMLVVPGTGAGLIPAPLGAMVLVMGIIVQLPGMLAPWAITWLTSRPTSRQ
jgi:hypothetical protein